MRFRFLLLTSIALCACGAKEKPAPTPKCGDYEDFGLALCDRSTLAQVQADGVWNLQLKLDGYEPDVASFSLKPEASSLLGHPTDGREVGGDKVFLSTSYPSSYSGRTIRWSLAGCTASSPTAMTGKVSACVDGQRSVVGTFDAKRVQRIAGEQEGSGLELVGEAKAVEGIAVDVTVSGDVAYVAALEGGVTVFDVSDRSHPTVMASIPADGGYWNDVAVVNQELYVATAEQGVLAFDVSTPSSPKRQSAFPSESTNVHTLLVDGTRLYAMAPEPVGETIIFDASTTPLSELGRFRANGADPSTLHWPHDACVLDNTLYVNHWASGLVAANVSNPASPSQLFALDGTHKTSHACAVGRFGSQVFLYEGGEDWGAGLRAFDVTNPSAPSGILSQTVLRPEVSIHNLQLKGNTLYVAWYQDGLRAFDLTDPAHPTQAAYFNTWREADKERGESFYDGAIGVTAPGDGFVYVAESSRGLMIFKER